MATPDQGQATAERQLPSWWDQEAANYLRDNPRSISVFYGESPDVDSPSLGNVQWIRPDGETLFYSEASGSVGFYYPHGEKPVTIKDLNAFQTAFALRVYGQIQGINRDQTGLFGALYVSDVLRGGYSAQRDFTTLRQMLHGNPAGLPTPTPSHR